MKKVFSLILALGLIASLTACGGGNASGNETGDSAPAASTAKLRFVTGGESGTYYAFGSVIAQHATNNTNVSVTGLVGNGSKSNVEELADGNAELAFCQSDVMAYAYNGTNLFERPPGRLLLHRGRPVHGACADRHHRSRHQDRG